MKFQKENFSYHGGYLHYDLKNGERPQFIARFKYRGGDMSGFKKFLIANFTVEEYIEAYAGGRGPAPFEILRAKGYMPKWLKEFNERYDRKEREGA